MSSKRIFIVILLTISLVAIFYSKIFLGFFQHDEWQTFASTYLINYGGPSDVYSNVFLPRASHFAPLFVIIFKSLFSVFGLNYTGYVVTSLFLHLTIVLLVFIFTQRLTGKLILSILSALFFGLNASAHQATTWIIANINTHGATIFGLLSIITFLYFLNKSTKRNFLFLVSIVLLIISLLFKEITIAFFAILPVVFILYTKAKTRKSQVTYISIILGSGLLYFAFRLSMFFMPVSDREYVVLKDQQVSQVVYNTFSFPAKIFTQSVIPTWQLLDVAKATTSVLPDSITGKPKTTEFDRFVENVTLQLLDFTIFIMATLVVLYILKSNVQKSHKKIILLSFVFIILNSFIYALSPARSGLIPVIDSRNIYLPAIGTSIFIATLIHIVAQGKVIKILLLFTPLIFLHIYWLNEQLELRAEIGSVRKNILQQIKSEHPTLPEKVVFFVASDTAYYGMAEKIPPFETGLGQALLVWYHPTERFPTSFFGDWFLRFITDQGYREGEGRGFGYFRDMNKLKETMKQNNLSLESVIGYRYYGNTNTLQETTLQTREELTIK